MSHLTAARAAGGRAPGLARALVTHVRRHMRRTVRVRPARAPGPRHRHLMILGVVVMAVGAPPVLGRWLTADPLPEVITACVLLLAVPTIVARTAAGPVPPPSGAACDGADGCRRHSVSVAAVVVRQGRVLAVQRRSCGRWELPGGVLERAETIEAGLVREVQEETGITVEPLAHTGVYKHMGRGIVSLVFLCRVVGGNAHHGTPETLAVRWMTLREVMCEMRDTFPLRVLDAIAEGPSGPGDGRVIRNHDGVEVSPVA